MLVLLLLAAWPIRPTLPAGASMPSLTIAIASSRSQRFHFGSLLLLKRFRRLMFLLMAGFHLLVVGRRIYTTQGGLQDLDPAFDPVNPDLLHFA